MTVTRRVALTLVAGLLSTFGLSVLPAAVPTLVPASATNTYLCTGYAGCKAAGYGNAGYAQNGDQMYWRMYAGHNCTNYVAYRLVQSGLPNERPWTGSGNATNWGVAMSDITDQTPMVGAVAWWKANTPGAGSAGHVAIVEQVVSADEIVVSEDMWGGDFHWARITRSGTGWPSGFIHFNDRVLAPATPPAVQGTPTVGQTVTADPGDWGPSDPTLKVQWLAAGVPIDGATSTTLAVTPELVDKPLRVKVVATRKGYQSGSATSKRSRAVRPGSMTVDQQPVVGGTPRVGETLTAGTAAWEPAASDVAVQWFADGTAIDGATGSTLALDPDLVGAAITVQQTATTPGYRPSTATSVPTAAVKPGRMTVTSPYEVQGATRVGRTLSIQDGAVSPSDAQASYTWTRDGAVIDGAVGQSYTLTTADVGHRIAASVKLVRQGYQSLTVPLTTPGPVTTTPVMHVRTHGTRAGRVVVKLRVSADGVQEPGGHVVAWIGDHRAEGDLVDGVVRLVLTGLKQGLHHVHVSYGGTSVVEGGHVVNDVTVPKPKG